MTGLNYPDNLYADHEERKARRSQEPTGAYRAPAEIPESERKLRTALAYVNHARDLIRDALGDNEPKAATPEPERVPKWDPKWAATQSEAARKYIAYWDEIERITGTLRAYLLRGDQQPNCDGHHPMHAVAIQDHDERLAGGESHL